MKRREQVFFGNQWEWLPAVMVKILMAVLMVAILDLRAAESDQARTATLTGPSPVVSRLKNIDIRLLGQLNPTFIYAANGETSDFFIVDNDSSPSRFIIDGIIKDTNGIKTPMGFNIEVGLKSSSSGTIVFEKQTDDFVVDGRKLEVFWKDPSYGTVWLGKGDTATNGISERDLSGTYVIGYSQVRFMGPNLTFENGGPRLNEVFSNFDGLHRGNRFRYDTPSWGGVTVSGSIVTGERFDLAVRYKESFDFCKTEAAVGIADRSGGVEQLSGSLSVLLNNGLNVTAACGGQDIEGRDPLLLYGKIGWRTNIFNCGESCFAVDYGYNEDVTLKNEEGVSYALMYNQVVKDYSSELYVGIRNYEVDTPGADYHDVLAVMAGIRLKF